MRAARLHAPGALRVEGLPPPVPQPGEVLLRVDRVGICGSDVHLYQGDRPAPYPLILGHEAIGRIESVGPGVGPERVGERVVVEPNIACGFCVWCRRGRGAICPHKRSLGVNMDGALAEYVALPATHAWVVPDRLRWQDAVLIEPFAVAVHAHSVSSVAPGDRAVVLGCGTIGLLLTHLLSSMHIDVLAIDLDARRLDAARRAGADEVLIMKPDAASGIAERVRESAGCSVVFECSGSAPGAEWCFAAVPRGGTVVMIGLATEAARVQPLRVVREGVTITGSLTYDHPDDFRRAIRLVQAGMRVGDVVEQEFSIDDVEKALVAARGALTGKAVIRVG